jgi:hypothetical protein
MQGKSAVEIFPVGKLYFDICYVKSHPLESLWQCFYNKNPLMTPLFAGQQILKLLGWWL